MKITITKSRNTFTIMCVASIAFFVLAYFVGSRGADDGLASVERLQLVWPDVLDLPQDDRILLAKLSMECNLNQVPKDRDAVIGCLKLAANNVTDSQGVSGDSSRVKDELNFLLEGAPLQ